MTVHHDVAAVVPYVLLTIGICGIVYAFLNVGEHAHRRMVLMVGHVPDKVLAAIYNGMRNYSFTPDVALRVRQLAGCVDEKGQLLPGYVLHNGYITDAQPQVAEARP